MDHSGHEGSHGSGSSATATKPPSSASSSSSSSSSAAADHSAHSSSGSEHMSMRPYLFSSTTDFYILFKQARIGNTGGFVLAFFMTFLFGILTTVGFEFGKRLERSALAAKLVKERKAFPRVVVGALGHGLRLLLHYTAMLIVMTMNIWIILALLVGHMIGWLMYTLLTNSKETFLVSKEAEQECRGCDC